MNRILHKPTLAALLLLGSGCVAHAQACPNATSSVTIPLSGSTLVTMYDQSCNILPGSSLSALFTFSTGPVNSTSAPSMTTDAAGLHFSANGAAPGAAGTFKITYTPNGQTFNLTYVVGAPVTAISAGTTTP